MRILKSLQPGIRRLKERPDLILHIGMPKTGTTAVQTFLFNNRAALAASQGVYYPDHALHWEQHVAVVKCIIENHFPFAHFNQAIPSINIDQWLDQVITTCNEQRCHTAIISSEFFWAAPAMQASMAYHGMTELNSSYLKKAVELFKEAFTRFKNIKIVVYLRRQDRWLESFFIQQLKNGFPIPSAEELLPIKNYLLYHENISWWCDLFGQENVIVRTFEGTENIIVDFCRLACVSLDSSLLASAYEKPNANPRLSPRGVRTMLMAIEKDFSTEEKELLAEVLTSTSAEIPLTNWGNYSGLYSFELLSNVRAAYVDDTRKLVKQFPAASAYLTTDEISLQPAVSEDEKKQFSREEKLEILLERLLERS